MTEEHEKKNMKENMTEDMKEKHDGEQERT